MTLLLAVALLAQDAEKDARADLELQEYADRLKAAKDDDGRIRAIQGLGDVRHARLLEKLKELLAEPSAYVRGYTLKEIAKYAPEPAAVAILATQLKEELKTAKQDDQASDTGHENACEIIRSLAKFPADKQTDKLLTDLFTHENLAVARQAVGVCAELKRLDTVDPLIKLLETQEKVKAEPLEANSKSGQVSGLGKLSAAEAKKAAAYNRKTQMTERALGALQSLLGDKTLQNAKACSAFWSKNKKKLQAEEVRSK